MLPHNGIKRAGWELQLGDCVGVRTLICSLHRSGLLSVKLAACQLATSMPGGADLHMKQICSGTIDGNPKALWHLALIGCHGSKNVYSHPGASNHLKSVPGKWMMGWKFCWRLALLCRLLWGRW